MSAEFRFDQELQIGGKIIGGEAPVYIIAEIGINHNGDIGLAKKSIRSAANAGADAVKFQTFRADEFMADKNLIYEYLSSGLIVRESMYEMFKRLEMPLDWHLELKEYAKTCGVEFLTSIADPISMAIAIQAGVAALKLASEDLINLKLLKLASTCNLPLILSSGMANQSEIQDAINILAGANKRNIALLHCVSLYPTNTGEANLRRLLGLRARTGAFIGYSDHTIGSDAAVGSVYLGAKIIEKHFTLDKALPGPDHSFSSDSMEFELMVNGIRRAEKLFGCDYSDIIGRELISKQQFRRSIVASRDLVAGDVLSASNIAIRRPEGGIHPRYQDEIMGMKLLADIKENQQITWEVLAAKV